MSEQTENIKEEIKENEPEKEGLNLADELIEWAESFVFAIFVIILVFTFIFRIVQVDGPSMEDTLHNGDRLILTHFNYTPQRGDVVVLNSRGLNETIIKRVIAVEGDTISIDFVNGIVTLNGEELKEDYIKEPTYFQEGRAIENLTIGEGQVFVMGDNRNHSTDSRAEIVGVIDTEDILGKAIFRIYPTSDIGKVE